MSITQTIFEFPSCEDTYIWQLNLSDAQYICFRSAVQNRVFDIVKEHQPIERTDLIQKAKYGKRGGEAVINVVTGLGLLKCSDKKYYLTELSRNFLIEKSVYSWRPMLNVFPEKFTKELKLIEEENFLDSGIIKKWDDGQIDTEQANKFTQFMQSSNISASNGFAKRVNLKEKFGIQSFIDVGAGSGCFSIAAVHHQPGIRAILYDLEPVCKIAQTYIDKSGLEEGGVITYSGNMFKEPFPANNDPKYGYQAMFYSNIFHDWSEEKCKYLAKKTYDALPENGVILLHEALLNEDGNGPLITAFLSFQMFLVTEGKQFTFNELEKILNEAGFKDVGIVPTYGIFSLVHGRK